MLLFISGPEIFIILIGYLLIFGSKSIPGLARTLGRTARQVKDATDEIKRDLNASAGDIKKEFDQHKKDFEDLGKD
ncbi:MAG: twin-arginine translocase TatA/TatE family subunit [Bacteroidota bacterium]